MTQDYTDPLFIEQERDKVVQEIVRAFSDDLSAVSSDSIYAKFLRHVGVYTGPYQDTPASQKEKFARISEQTFAERGPRFNTTIDGSKSVFVPGMCKHAFNAGAADLNGAIAGSDADYISQYKGGAKALETMAWSVSEAILHKD